MCSIRHVCTPTVEQGGTRATSGDYQAIMLFCRSGKNQNSFFPPDHSQRCSCPDNLRYHQITTMHSLVQPDAWVALKLPTGNLRVLQVTPNT